MFFYILNRSLKELFATYFSLEVYIQQDASLLKLCVVSFCVVSMLAQSSSHQFLLNICFLVHHSGPEACADPNGCLPQVHRLLAGEGVQDCPRADLFRWFE